MRSRFGMMVGGALALLMQAGMAATVGTLDMGGDPVFDGDSIANADSNQWRWLSYPGARLCLNPSSRKTFMTPPVDPGLALHIGGYVGLGVVRLSNVVSLAVAEGAQSPAMAPVMRRTAWYPHKLAFEADFPGGARVSGCDFFKDADSTVIRVMEVQGGKDLRLCLGGSAVSSGGIRWDAARQVLVMTGTNYVYALKVLIPGKAADSLGALPEIEGAAWSLRLPVGTKPATVAVAFGFAPAVEGEAVAVGRAVQAFAQPVAQSLAHTKALMEGYLKAVPKPARWGLDGIAAHGVTAEQHRRAYYAAWAFLVQGTLDACSDNPAYPYPQVLTGKPSLWDEGEKTSPGSASWESFMGCQWVSWLAPELAWKAYEGIMSRVDETGMIGGESLPSRKAQTAWILHSRQADRTRLAAVYPAIKRYLLWRERHPRWIYGEANLAEEKDLEFVTAWLIDVDYAIRIANELGLSGDTRFWHDRRTLMMANLRSWFFNDPAAIHQFWFTERKVHSFKHRTKDIPMMIASTLAVRDLPADLAGRLKDYILSFHKPVESCGGFPESKYPDANYAAYGLLDHGMVQARPFVQAILRDLIRGVDFAEVTEAGPKPGGVRPSLFIPLNIIEFTWLMNNVRYETGMPVAFDWPESGVQSRAAEVKQGMKEVQ